MFALPCGCLSLEWVWCLPSPEGDDSLGLHRLGSRESAGELGSGWLRISGSWEHSVDEPQNQKGPRILGSGVPGTLPILG